MRKLRQLAVLPFLLVLLEGCSYLRPPAQLSPIGDIAFQAHRIILGIQAIQTLAIDGEAQGVISRNDARVVVQATKVAGQAGVELADALKAGASESSAKARAIAIIKQELTTLPSHLSTDTAKMLEPYLKSTILLLSIFQRQ